MTRHTHLDPSPFTLAGGSVGVLLLHGFTGAPPEMRLLAERLHAAGCTVSVPLLPGHGTSVAHLNYVGWGDWITHAEEALEDLSATCPVVFLGGLSMGALVALQLAARFQPDGRGRPGSFSQGCRLAGLMLYAPAIRLADPRTLLVPILKRFRESAPKGLRSDFVDPTADQRVWCYDVYPLAGLHEVMKLQRRVRSGISEVRCPVLLFRSARDQAVRAAGIHHLFRRLPSRDKEIVTLLDSGHCLTVDAEWRFVGEKSARFVQRLHTMPALPGP